MLDEKQDAPMKTRFPMWHRLVGSAVEHASRCAAWFDPDMPDQALDFGSLFLDQETDDEDATELGEALCSLNKVMAAEPFKAVDLANAITLKDDDDWKLEENARTVRGWLFPDRSSEVPVAASAVGKQLKKYIGHLAVKPRACGAPLRGVGAPTE